MRRCPTTVLPPPRIARGRRRALGRLAAVGLATALAPARLPAQGVELDMLRVRRSDAELTLDYSARLVLSPSLEDALHRGVPMHFVAQATLWRSRWYWRDERLARVSRSWRVAYQPLTASWRVTLGGLSQLYGSLAEALASMSRVSGWRLADADRLGAGERHYVEFGFRLDVSQLPPPMQIDVGNDYKLAIERSLRLE